MKTKNRRSKLYKSGRSKTHESGRFKMHEIEQAKIMRANGLKCTKNGPKWLKTDEKIKHGRGRYKAHESGWQEMKESGRLKQMDFRHS